LVVFCLAMIVQSFKTELRLLICNYKWIYALTATFRSYKGNGMSFCQYTENMKYRPWKWAVLNYGGNLNNVTEKYVQCARSPQIQRQYHIAISKCDPANDLTDLFCTGVSKFYLNISIRSDNVIGWQIIYFLGETIK
jgi:hypothetical protein